MPFNGLREFISALETEGELLRIQEFVDPILEIAEITDRISKSGVHGAGGKALLFENNGSSFPLLINSLGSYKRMCLALGVDDLDLHGEEIGRIIRKITTPRQSSFDKIKLLPLLGQISSWTPKLSYGKGDCQEVIIRDPDLGILPVMKCWPGDGGRFITLPVVITRDPESGIRNAGMYRMQVFDRSTTGMHWHIHKGGAAHFRKYAALKMIMPVAVALGGDPVYTYTATAPLPENIDEFLFAGYLRKKRVRLVKAITQDIEVPADAD
ncbi:MAG: UbiD family decarboxylase, partial [Bacteroidetes bacterium]|nr:UbiD family decarboxylase [Bacteroidota bacterium]